MRINGVDIKKYNARQWNVFPAFTSLSNASEWIEGSRIPLLLPSKAGIKKIKVSVMIKGEDRKEIWKNGSDLVAALLQPAEIELEGFRNKFYGALINAEQAELSLQRFHKTTLELAGYEHGPEITLNFTEKEMTVTNPGNLPTPVTLELTPLIGKQLVRISGIVRNEDTGADKPVEIKRLSQNKKIIINGETGLITEEGENKFQDITIWDLPSLQPGNNTITLDQDAINVTLKFKPRYA